MAKAIHSMVRVMEEQRSVDFYQKAFDLSIDDRLDFDSFTLLYLSNSENSFELELTVNKGQSETYELGNAYGHFAVCVDDLELEHQKLTDLGYQPRDIVEFNRESSLLAKFFFVTDPDGYSIEVLQKHGRYQ
jgi:lactoylglutathione lyase